MGAAPTVDSPAAMGHVASIGRVVEGNVGGRGIEDEPNYGSTKRWETLGELGANKAGQDVAWRSVRAR